MDVLIVDDDKSVLKAHRALLEGCGCQVETAENGRDAIAMTKKVEYSLIFVDYSLPDLNGLDVIAAIGQHSNAPVLLVTAYPSMEMQAASINTNVEDLLTKPLNKNQITAILAQYR